MDTQAAHLGADAGLQAVFAHDIAVDRSRIAMPVKAPCAVVLHGPEQRASGQQLATKLLKADDNQRIDILDLRGAIARDLHGAFKEWQAQSTATLCRKYLYFLAINPDPSQDALTQAHYFDLLERVGKKLGLSAQPRAVVLHVHTDGRERCYVVWSRIAADGSGIKAMARRFFSCVGNMVLLPTPLKAFTDTMPEVKAILRICARNLYGWQCDHDNLLATNTALDGWTDWEAYPESWPRTPHEKLPAGVVALTPAIRTSAQKRLDTIRRDLENAGSYYPRDEVRAALAYWKIEL